MRIYEFEILVEDGDKPEKATLNWIAISLANSIRHNEAGMLFKEIIDKYSSFTKHFEAAGRKFKRYDYRDIEFKGRFRNSRVMYWFEEQED